MAAYAQYTAEHGRPAAKEVLAQAGCAYWRAQGRPAIYFPAGRLVEDGENRLVEHERPYADGAKVDDTGSKAKRWTVDVLFENSSREPGLEGNGGKALYPDVLDLLIDSFDVHETGDLYLPTRGIIRCRAQKYTRTEDPMERDSARAELSWVRDNEDATTAASVQHSSVHGAAKTLSGTTTFTAQAAGAWNGSISDLNGALSDLEGLANAPSTYAGELQDRARIVRHDAERGARLLSQVTGGKGDDRALLLDPANNAVVRKLLLAADTSAAAEGDSSSGNRPRVVSVSFGTPRTLASIAAQYGEDYQELLALNQGRIEDPCYIEPGTVVRVYAVGG